MLRVSVSLFALALLGTPIALAQDADGDGVLDAAGGVPRDTNAAAEPFAPAEGVLGALSFEDLWPFGDDRAANDAVVAYHCAFQHTAHGRVRSIRATFDVLAAGGEVDLGLALQLPLPATSVAQASRRQAARSGGLKLGQCHAKGTDWAQGGHQGSSAHLRHV